MSKSKNLQKKYSFLKTLPNCYIPFQFASEWADYGYWGVDKRTGEQLDTDWTRTLDDDVDGSEADIGENNDGFEVDMEENDFANEYDDSDDYSRKKKSLGSM